MPSGRGVPEAAREPPLGIDCRTQGRVRDRDGATGAERQHARRKAELNILLQKTMKHLTAATFLAQLWVYVSIQWYPMRKKATMFAFMLVYGNTS